MLAHELTHVKNRDILTSSIAAAMAGVISWTAQMAFFFGGRSDDDDGGGLGGLFTILLAPIAAGLIQMAISRSREYAADEGGGSLCGNPRYLAKALEKLDYYAKHGDVMQDATPATAHMFIINRRPPPSRGAMRRRGGSDGERPPLEGAAERMRGWGSSRENKPNEHMKMLLKHHVVIMTWCLSSISLS